MKTKTKQMSRTGTESQKWTSHGGFSEEQREKGTGNEKHNWQAQHRQGEVKNGIGNRIQRTYMYNPWT